MFPGSLNRLSFCQEKNRTEERIAESMQETIARNKVNEVVEANQAPQLEQTAREPPGAKLQEARAPHFETATT